MNFKQIIEAWLIARNPTELQIQIAKERGKICDACPSKKIITGKLKLGTICGECGCPIGKKIFTNEYNPCPLQKWENVDSKYFTVPTLKKNNTII